MERHQDLEISFGAVLRERRTLAGLSQERLAEAAGLHRNYIGLVERAANSPSLSAIAAIASALGVEVSDLVIAAEQHAREATPSGGTR